MCPLLLSCSIRCWQHNLLRFKHAILFQWCTPIAEQLRTVSQKVEGKRKFCPLQRTTQPKWNKMAEQFLAILGRQHRNERKKMKENAQKSNWNQSAMGQTNLWNWFAKLCYASSVELTELKVVMEMMLLNNNINNHRKLWHWYNTKMVINNLSKGKAKFAQETMT